MVLRNVPLDAVGPLASTDHARAGPIPGDNHRRPGRGSVALGVPLSMGSRRSGSLLVPGVAHALNDAIRNVLVGLP